MVGLGILTGIFWEGNILRLTMFEYYTTLIYTNLSVIILPVNTSQSQNTNIYINILKTTEKLGYWNTSRNKILTIYCHKVNGKLISTLFIFRNYKYLQIICFSF